jgi:hypothetical protein
VGVAVDGFSCGGSPSDGVEDDDIIITSSILFLTVFHAKYHLSYQLQKHLAVHRFLHVLSSYLLPMQLELHLANFIRTTN